MNMEVEGLFNKTFQIAAPLEAVFAFISDFRYTLPRMPQVERVLRFSNDRYRMFYSAEVVSGFKMHILFDMRPQKVDNQQLKFIPIPVSKEDLIKARSSGYRSLHAGKFSAVANFSEADNYCKIDYTATIVLQVEVPNSLRFLPLKTLFKMGSGILSFKMDSIGDDMAQTLPVEYVKWSRENSAILEEILKTS